MKKVLALLLAVSMLVGLLPTFALAADTGMKADKTYIVLAPGNFTDNGAWTIEKENNSGISYMIAGKDKRPKASQPATISVVFPKAGKYKVYALSRDYATNGGSRYYDVKVGTNTFRMGDHAKDGWFWQASETFSVLPGEELVSVVDVAGNYARCAVLVITDDLDYKAGTTKEDIEQIAEKQYKVGDIKIDDSSLPSGRPQSDIAVCLNGEWMTFDVDPILLNDRTMVPFRAIFEALGCTVSWDEDSQTAKGSRNGLNVALPIGEKRVTVGDNTVELDQPAVVKDDRTLVPLRFVSEALGAQVRWLEDSQSVLIEAVIPQETVFITQRSFSDVGTWTMDKSSDVYDQFALKGLMPTEMGATQKDADTSNARPAIANFNLSQGGTYKVWCHSRDFATNQQGDRFFNLAFNDQPMLEHRFGAHGKDGYAWDTAGTIELPKGKNTLYVHDTSGFYARFDGIIITKDLDYVPPESYDEILKVALPNSNTIDTVTSSPAYAVEQNSPTESASIENDKTKVVFYKVPTSKGQVVQNEIYSMHNGEWVKTKARDEALSYLVMRADSANYSVNEYRYGISASFDYYGDSTGKLATNPYEAGFMTWFVPNDYSVVNDKQIVLSFPASDAGTMQVTWTMDEQTDPLVSVDTTVGKDGYYTVAAFEGGEFKFEDFDYALAPFRIQYKRVGANPELISETYLFTPMGTYTLSENNKYSKEAVTKGVVVEPSWIPLRWTYNDNVKFGITMHSAGKNYSGGVFAPVMGSEDSKKTAGQSLNLKVRIVSRVGGWFDTYADTTENLFEVTDYRKNYVNSLNDAIFNTRDLMMDDVYGGWDVHDMAHYNMEGRNWTSVGNAMQAMQDYLLTEDEDIMTRRAIPTIANTLSRGNIHFNRIGDTANHPGGGAYWAKLTDPNKIGQPVGNYNANVIGGMYEMTRGTVPFLYNYALKKGKTAVVSGYGSVASFSNDLNMYKYTGDKAYLDSAVKKADEYLEKNVYAANDKILAFDSFIYISYYPNLASLIDIYEVTKDQKYLDAAENVAQWMATGLWVPGMDGEKKEQKLVVNDVDEARARGHYGQKTTTFFWAGDKQFRIGRENDVADLTNDVHISDNKKEVDSWIPSRVGLGIEQASTFTRSSHIIMQSFAGDFMKVAAYTGNPYYATMARNAIIGRFRSYDGYYRTFYETYTQETNYPYEGPDYTGIYWHHIPPFLAMLEDFLINQTFAWSGKNIEFPSLRQQGYAYFNSNQYGHEAGKFYDEDNMWAWLDRGIATTDNIQIDWMAARKDGVMGLALMNEDDTDVTTTVTLGEKVPGGADYSGTANLYDKSGKIGTVEVVNGAFTVTVPAKSLQAVTIKIDGVKAPAYSKTEYSLTSAEIGATVSEHENGKGYTLQMSPDCYYAYLYVTDLPKEAKSATFTYDIGGGEKKSVTADVYPFETIIKVDDVNKELNYSVQVTKADGTTADYGKDTLMTAALSAAKGIKYEDSASTATSGSQPAKGESSDAAKKLKFTAFPFKYSGHGCAGGAFRFIVKLADIPFKVTEDNMIGLPIEGELVDGDTKIPFKSTITGVEFRGDDGAVIMVAETEEVSTTKYPESWNKTHKFNLTVSPLAK